MFHGLAYTRASASALLEVTIDAVSVTNHSFRAATPSCPLCEGKMQIDICNDFTELAGHLTAAD